VLLRLDFGGQKFRNLWAMRNRWFVSLGNLVQTRQKSCATATCDYRETLSRFYLGATDSRANRARIFPLLVCRLEGKLTLLPY
jgi:hypothetical protein